MEDNREGTNRARPDLLFLFSPNDRLGGPDLRAIVDGIGNLAVTLDRAVPEGKPPHRESLWVELTSDGLTFDCSGLAPGPPEPLPTVNDWLGVPMDDRADRLRCVGLALGPHLRAGQASPPILRGLLTLARNLALQFKDCRGVCWSASGMVVEREAFLELVTRWLEGGSFPAQLVTSLKVGLGGGIETRGLAYFTGQELRVEPVSFQDEGQGALLALRLACQLIYQGPLETVERATAPDGSALRLEPSPNGRFVRVWAG